MVFEASLSWKEKGVGAGLIQAQIQAPHLRLKSRNLAEPQFPNLESGDNKRTASQGYCEDEINYLKSLSKH